VQKTFAVAMTAALLLPTVATSAAAQQEKITIEGVNFLDRNNNQKPDAGETPRSGLRMSAVDTATHKVVWEFTTGADGRYKAVLDKGPKYAVGIANYGDYTSNRPEWILSESRADADFGFAGYFLEGFTFVDANGDGDKQDDEKTHEGLIKVTGKSLSGVEVNVETRSDADGSYRFDLPLGQYQVNAPDLKRNGLALAKPKSDNDIDWVTGTLAFPTGSDGKRNYRADMRYFEPKGDGALEGTAISPAKDTYVVGDQIEVSFKLLNKGDVPGKLSVVMFGLGSMDAKLISLSDNVAGTMQDFETVKKLQPGESITVVLKLELASTELKEISPFARPFIGGFKDFDHKNQGQSFYKQIKVVEKGTTTEPSTTTSSSSATTAPTSTTATTVVAKAGNKSGLASTGASPLGLLALGSVLLAAGLGAFFVARRRRS
jgi:hypothetical protein